MKVHFIASRKSLEDDIASLRLIVNAIHAAGHVLARDWVEQAYLKHQQSKRVSDDWETIFRENIETVAGADVIIAETSYDSFAVGYQVALALQQKKPVLMLHHRQANKDAFATGVVNDWVQLLEYDERSIEPVVENFLKENDIQSKDMRFNFFIDRQIYNYLRWASHKTGETKAEILRSLVLREIEKDNRVD